MSEPTRPNPTTRPSGASTEPPGDKQIEDFARAIRGSCEIASSHYVYPRHAASVLKAAEEHGIRLVRAGAASTEATPPPGERDEDECGCGALYVGIHTNAQHYGRASTEATERPDLRAALERLDAIERFALHDPGVNWPSKDYKTPEAAIMAALDDVREAGAQYIRVLDREDGPIENYRPSPAETWQAEQRLRSALTGATSPSEPSQADSDRVHGSEGRS